MDPSLSLNEDVEATAAGRDEKKINSLLRNTPTACAQFQFGFDKLHASHVLWRAKPKTKDDGGEPHFSLFRFDFVCQSFFYVMPRATSLTRCQFGILPRSRKLNGILVSLIWRRVKCQLCVNASFRCHRRHRMRSRQTNGIWPMNFGVLQTDTSQLHTKYRTVDMNYTQGDCEVRHHKRDSHSKPKRYNEIVGGFAWKKHKLVLHSQFHFDSNHANSLSIHRFFDTQQSNISFGFSNVSPISRSANK